MFTRSLLSVSRLALLALLLVSPAVAQDNILISQPNGTNAVISATNTASVYTLNVNCPTCSGGGGGITIGTTTITSGVTNQLLYDNAGIVGEVTKANSSVLITNGSGVPSWGTTLPNINIGTPTAGVATNLTGTASGLTAGNVTTNANLTGDVTSVGNATTLVTAQPGAHTWALGQTFSSAMTYGGVTLSNAVTGTGNMVLSAAPTFTTSITHGVGPAILTSNAAASTMLGAATSATAAVAQTLTVSGSSGNSAAAALFTIAGSDQTGTGTTGGELRLRAGNGVTQGGIISFYTSPISTPTLAMIITKDQKVGIGVAAPTAAAFTVHNDTVDPLRWGSSSTDVGVLSYSGSAGAETSVAVGAITNIPLNLRVNNATRFTISATAGTVKFGAADAASPVAQIATVQNVVAGNANTAGVPWTLIGSLSNGSGVGGDIILQTSLASAASGSQNAAATSLTLKAGTQNAVFAALAITAGFLVSTLPAGVTGARAHVTDQLTTCAAIGTPLTGGGAVTCPAFYNGTAWVGG